MPELTVTHKKRMRAKPAVHSGDVRILKNLYDALYRPYKDFVVTVRTSMGVGEGERGSFPAEEFFYPK